MVRTLLTAVVSACVRRAGLVFALGLLCAVGAGWVAATRLGVTTDVDTLFAADLPWKQREAELERLFPQFSGLLVAVVQARSPEEAEATAAVLVNHYARRWTIEPAFRDTKDLRFGMGLSATRIGEPMRCDRLLLISAFATALLTLLGAVGESLGMDRLLKSNTSKTRTHSLFRQGCMLYDLIPNMPEHRLAPLMQNFADAVSKAGVFIPKLASAK